MVEINCDERREREKGIKCEERKRKTEIDSK